MSTKYYTRNQNLDTGCDSTNPNDLSLLRGVPGVVTVSQITTNTSFEEGFTFDIDPTKHASIPSGLNSMLMSVNFNSVPANGEARFRVAAVDSGCSEISFSTYSPVVSASGIATHTAGLVGANLTRLRLSIEIRSTNGLSANFSVSVNNNDSFVEAPWSYTSRREQIIAACLNRLQQVGQIKSTGTILVEDEDAITPSAHLWAVSEVKERRSFGSSGGHQSSEFRIGVRVIDRDINALDNLADLMKYVEIAIVSNPVNLGLDFVINTELEEAIVASTSEEISSPFGLAELVFLVTYNQEYGVP